MSKLDDPANDSGILMVQIEAAAGETLAALVRELAPGTSWSKARELCRSGRVWVDGERATDPARRMAAGERIELRTGEPALRREPAAAVVHLDADIVVVRKPAGLLTVPFAKDDRDTLLSLTRVAVRRLESARGQEANPSLRAVQRLDKDTSGLVVFARNVRAQRLLQEQLGEHTVTRRYLALVHGAAEDAIYDTLLVHDRGDGLRGSWGVFRPAEGNPPDGAKNATTYVSVLERLRRATLLSCSLETGRQHQIRIHLAEAGHPLVGETVYIRGWHGPIIEAPRLMLHAAVLGFIHPRTNRPVEFEDPPPADFEAVLERLRRPGVKP
ncbi:MAG TPA: RluA family pseudouridine synthase [Thermoanaerobaculia bacterium]|nr:RluA family pseudouridine synthase [Thermoanaerobaculia bacterium]